MPAPVFLPQLSMSQPRRCQPPSPSTRPVTSFLPPAPRPDGWRLTASIVTQASCYRCIAKWTVVGPQPCRPFTSPISQEGAQQRGAHARTRPRANEQATGRPKEVAQLAAALITYG